MGSAASLLRAALSPPGRAEVLVAQDGRILSWSPEAEEVYGYDPGAVVGRSAALLASEEGRDALLGLIGAAASDGRLHVVLLGCRKADGSPVHMIARAGGVPGPDGGPVRVRLICQDAEAGQRPVVAGPDVLTDLMAEHVYVKDGDLVYRYSSEAFARALGTTPDAVVGRSDHDLLPRDQADREREDDRRVMAEGHPAVAVEELAPFGPARRVKVPLGGPGEAAGILGAWVWLDAREQARRALSHWLGFVAACGDAVVGTDPDGTVLSWSPGAARLYGYEADDIRGQSLGVLLPAEGRPEMLAAVQQAAGGQVVPEREAVHVRADGTQVRVAMALRPAAGLGHGAEGLCITVREAGGRRAGLQKGFAPEGRLQQTEKLESLGILAGGIARDFSNLLTGILGSAALMVADLPPGSPARDRLAEIEQGAHRAAHLCAQMLAYSGHGRFVVQPADLSDVVRRAANLLEAAVPAKCVVEYQLADGLPFVEADESQLRQVLMNLVTNAAEAIGQRTGFLVVHTGVCRADRGYLSTAILGDEREEGDYAYLEVSDTGSGMDEETRRCAFDPFFSTKFTGRGLGLAAVLGIVRGHGGAIHVDSQPGAGTRMRVLLPAAETRVAASTETELAWAASGTILVAGAGEVEALLARAMLTRSGFAVLAASNEVEAVRLLGERRSETVAALVGLAGADPAGLRLPGRLREVRKDLPIVMLSDLPEDEVRARVDLGDGVRFLRWPCAREDLAAALRDLLAPPGPA